MQIIHHPRLVDINPKTFFAYVKKNEGHFLAFSFDLPLESKKLVMSSWQYKILMSQDSFSSLVQLGVIQVFPERGEVIDPVTKELLQPKNPKKRIVTSQKPDSTGFYPQTEYDDNFISRIVPTPFPQHPPTSMDEDIENLEDLKDVEKEIEKTQVTKAQYPTKPNN